MSGRGKFDKSQRRNRSAIGKPSDLDQFGQRMAKSSDLGDSRMEEHRSTQGDHHQ